MCVKDFRGCVQGPRSAGPPLRRTVQNFILFFPRPPQFHPLLEVLSLNFCGVFEGRDPVHVGPLQTCTFPCTFQGPGASNTKIPRKDPQEREERKLWRARDKKKSAKFWAPPPVRGVPTFGASTISGASQFGALRRHVGLKRHCA